MDFARFLQGNINLKLGNFTFAPSYFYAGAIVFLLFLLLMTMASVRRHFLVWSFKGAWFGLFFGFLIALILEGFLILGGRTAVTGILGWKNAPKPLLTALDAGRSKLVNVLGVTEEIPSSAAKEDPTVDDAINIFQTLDPTEADRARSLICEP